MNLLSGGGGFLRVLGQGTLGNDLLLKTRVSVLFLFVRHPDAMDRIEMEMRVIHELVAI